ncbi:NEP1-interacting protein 1 [Ananas comosus]|uniref:NEP1-interacting protein 1 n=1 Tax=Ananas comosus TaxID=4615 RepID=A0A199UUT8_ANACO|nr:NEP1-interacting protein 1 [Ananas comosus]
MFSSCYVDDAVGVVLGAVTGGLIGVATESGVFRGTGIGAISGAVVSMDVVDSSLALLLSGRLVREKVDPAVQSAVRSQMNAVDSPFIEALDIFETEGTRGMPRASIDKLPEIKITNGGNVDATGERIGCSVCLQDFQVGESVRRLPTCHHMFHLICIDGWLIRHVKFFLFLSNMKW